MTDDIKSYYEEYGRKVYLYLMSLCSDADTAEELTQETFFQAVRSLSKYHGDCSVYTWLCSIAKNMWFRELKRRKRNPVAELDYSETDLSPPPDEIAELRDSKMNLLKQIHELPENEKEIILLRATGELTFREIGEIFGKSENWARVTFYRAKQKLKKE